MFAKLLKYDMKSIWRVWWIMAVGLFGLSVVGACVLRFILQVGDRMDEIGGAMAFLMFFGVLFLFGCFFAIVMSVLMTEILVYLRFYRHFFTDEGYLTFTLPVSRKSLFLSKTLNALFWFFAHLGLLVVCVLIFLLIAPPSDSALINPILFEKIGNFLSVAWHATGAWMILYVIEVLALLAGVELFSISLIHFCITIGAVIAKKLKLLAAIGIYYVVNMVLSFVLQFFGMIFVSMTIDGLITRIDAASWWLKHGMISVTLMIAVAIVAAVASVMYCITQNLLERKLNLA